MGPAKGKCGVRESVGKAFLYSRRMAVPGYRNINLNIVINTKYIYIYTYVKKMDKSIFDCFLFWS